MSWICYTAFDYYKNQFYYISENTPYFKAKENNGKNAYEFLLDNTSLEDVFIMHCIHQRALKFIMNQTVEDRAKYSFTFNIKMLVDGQKMDTTYKIKPEILDKKGNVWISLASLEPAKTFNRPQVKHLISGEGHFFKSLPKDRLKDVLSPTELKILSYLAVGDSYERICRQVNLKMTSIKG
jgi:hypothetical protein